ncbi:MAG: beta-Ala-His dipeptidase [Parabacteroides distasonis]
MSKPATPGMEDRPVVVLQSHMDMVCEKNNGTKHDFDNDPIETIVDGEWLRANGTTLGADNGIGVAAELALLASDDIQHGPIECLFTVDEETGLTGAKALKEGFMTGDILLNLDSEDEGEIFMGCAGGKDTQATFHYEPVPTSDKMQYFRIDVKGLNGGHRWRDPQRIRQCGNVGSFLFLLKKKYDFVLCSIDGGNLRNAIAREAHAVIGLHPENKEDVRILLNHFAADVENELKHVDPSVQLAMESTDRPEYHIDNATAEKLIYALHACPHGVIGMSHDIEGLVETSTNLASIKMKEGNTILIGTSQRSSIESCKIAIANTVASTFLLAGADVNMAMAIGWAPNPDSKILKIAGDLQTPIQQRRQIMAIHAGLECGLFLEKYPKLDMISFGPTLRDVHSPNERIEIATVGLWWSHLLELLKSIPAK